MAYTSNCQHSLRSNPGTATGDRIYKYKIKHAIYLNDRNIGNLYISCVYDSKLKVRYE